MNFTNVVLIALSILLPSLFLIKLIKKHKNLDKNKSFKTFLKNNSWELFIVLSLIIGFIFRLYKIGELPLGFNQDEASLGYDAWSILNYGIDRNGIQIPVHLIAWGSGQNALYAYLCMPFIKLFGLTEFAVRLPMALIGCISLIVLKKLLSLIGNVKLTAIGVFLLAIMPWHIMKSRWGLESNILPDLILLASMLIIIGIYNKPRYLYLGSIVLGLSAYAYGTSYFFLPIFLIIIFIYLITQKKILIKHAIISFLIVAVVSLPIILFVLINQFDWGTLTTPLFSIPKLNQARQASILNLNGNIFEAIWTNIKTNFELIILQNDSLPWNSIPFYGTHYVISLPFVFIGIFAMFRKKGFKIDFIFFAWLVTSLLMTTIISANINRINIIYIPIIYFVILGVYTIINNIKFSWIPIISLYIILVLMFVFTYFSSYQVTIGHYFFNGLGDAIEYSEELNPKTIIISNKINAPYIFTLFYSRTDPNEFTLSANKPNQGAAFETVSSFGKYEFRNIDPGNLNSGTVYILDQHYAYNIVQLFPKADIRYFDNFIVVIRR